MHAHHLDTPRQDLRSAAPPELHPELARVIAVAGDDFIVRRQGESLRARRAASCLVAPEPGDEVIAVTAGERTWIAAVLERSGATTTLSVSGDLCLCIDRGRLSATARDGVALASGRSISLTASAIDAQALEVSVVVERARTVARSVETVAEWVTLSATRCVRSVEELDQLRARVIDHAAEGLLRLRGATALLHAKALAKIDGRQIHVG